MGLLCIAVTACNQTPPIDAKRILAVDEVIANIDFLNGRTVRVGGYLGDCAGYDCGLYRDKMDKEQVDRWLAALRTGKKLTTDLPDWLSIGGFPEFDRKAAIYQDSYVLVTGKISNQCRNHGKTVCTDRAEEIVPTEIGSWPSH